MASEESETASIYTEPSAGDPERDAYGPMRVERLDPRVAEYRQWWRSNPLNNLFPFPKPSLWRRFKAEVVEGKSAEEAARSGANITLDDIKQPLPPHLPDWALTSSDAADDAADGDVLGGVASEDVWWGTPDPQVYAPGTLQLSRQQLDEERAKGSVATLHDFKQALASADDEELKVAAQRMQLHRLQNGIFVRTDDNKRISLWDLWNYVHHNPELKALAASAGPNSFPSAGTSGRARDQLARLLELTPWLADPDGQHLQLPPEQEARLGWGLAAAGTHYSRRPSRWLRGLDGRQDFTYGVYANEQRTKQLLGPRYAGRDPREVLGSPEYQQDVLAAAPGLGLTVMAVLSRPLDLHAARTSWEATLKQQLARVDALAAGAAAASSSTSSITGSGSLAPHIPRPRFGPLEESEAALGALGRLFDRERLAAATALLDATGEKLRTGSSLLLSTLPGGTVMVQAMTPGTNKERRAYLLGTFTDERLSTALVSLFTHPEAALDPETADTAGRWLLAFANGFRTNNPDANPSFRRPWQAAPQPVLLRHRGRGAQWRLPPLGAPPQAHSPLLVRDVRSAAAFKQVEDAFGAAFAAAAAVPVPTGGAADADAARALVVARRSAAEGALRRALTELGVEAHGLSLAVAAGGRPSRDLLTDAAAPLHAPGSSR